MITDLLAWYTLGILSGAFLTAMAMLLVFYLFFDRD